MRTDHAAVRWRGVLQPRRVAGLTDFALATRALKTCAPLDCGGPNRNGKFMIKVGDSMPDATLFETTEFGEVCPKNPTQVSVAEACAGKRIVIFGLPGAFTPKCTEQHLPGYLAQREALTAVGVDEVWCVAVNDAYVMAAWGLAHAAIGKIRMLGDGSGELAIKLGLEVDLSKAGMGTRIRRCSLLVERGVVTQVNVEGPGKFEVSDAATMLRQLA